MSLAVLLAAPALAAPYVGVDFVPFGRADQAWVAEEQLSGTLVGEADGLLVPPLTAWGGFVGKQHALLFGLAVARVTTASGSEGALTVRHVGALRPSADYRRYLEVRRPGEAAPYLQVGGYGVIPSARIVGEAFTKAEQADADADARADRARIGAYGGRAGGGVEVWWQNGLTVGARYLLVVHRHAAVVDDAVTTSVMVRGEAAFVLGFVL